MHYAAKGEFGEFTLARGRRLLISTSTIELRDSNHSFIDLPVTVLNYTAYRNSPF